MNTIPDTSKLNVYVAAPYGLAPVVRRIHTTLRTHHIQPVSNWAESASGPEDLSTLSTAEVRSIAARNDNDLLSAHVVLVLAQNGRGAEMFAEVALALMVGIPVLWCGVRRPLTAYRPGVLRADSIAHALGLLYVYAQKSHTPWPRDLEWTRAVFWDFIEADARKTEAAERAA